MDIEVVAKEIVDSAIKVHRELGPGLLESAYQICLAHELTKRGLRVVCEVTLPIHYDGLDIESGYRIDMLVENCVIIENKVVEQISSVHEAQLLTYLRLKGCWLGFLLNWNVMKMKYGIKRYVNGPPPSIPWTFVFFVIFVVRHLMQTRSRNTFTTIQTEGALLPTDLLQRVLSGDKDLAGLAATDYHLLEGEKLNEAINRSCADPRHIRCRKPGHRR
jgi:GxxExxY protein